MWKYLHLVIFEQRICFLDFVCYSLPCTNTTHPFGFFGMNKLPDRVICPSTILELSFFFVVVHSRRFFYESLVLSWCVNPSIPSKTREWFASVQQLQLAFMQSDPILWLHDLHVQTLSPNCVRSVLSSKFNFYPN